MNSILSKPPIYLAIAWLAVKILLFNLYPTSDTFIVGAGLNMFFVLLVILLELKQVIGVDSFLSQFKSVLKQAMVYILLMGAGVYIYYSNIDPENIQNKIALSQQGMLKEIEAQGGFDKFKEKNPSIKQKNLEDFIEDKKNNPPSFLTAQGQTLFSVMGMMMLATLLSAMFILVSRSVVRKAINQSPPNNSSASAS